MFELFALMVYLKVVMRLVKLARPWCAPKGTQCEKVVVKMDKMDKMDKMVAIDKILNIKK